MSPLILKSLTWGLKWHFYNSNFVALGCDFFLNLPFIKISAFLPTTDSLSSLYKITGAFVIPVPCWRTSSATFVYSNKTNKPYFILWCIPHSNKKKFKKKEKSYQWTETNHTSDSVALIFDLSCFFPESEVPDWVHLECLPWHSAWLVTWYIQPGPVKDKLSVLKSNLMKVQVIYFTDHQITYSCCNFKCSSAFKGASLN